MSRYFNFDTVMLIWLIKTIVAQVSDVAPGPHFLFFAEFLGLMAEEVSTFQLLDLSKKVEEKEVTVDVKKIDIKEGTTSWQKSPKKGKAVLYFKCLACSQKYSENARRYVIMIYLQTEKKMLLK